MVLQAEENWLTDFIQPPIGNEIRERVKHFTILWNMFEGFACGTRASMNIIVSIIDDFENRYNDMVTLSDNSFDYFANRYIEGGEPTADFTDLKVDANFTPFVLEVLKGIRTSLKDKVKALLLIVFRLRINLFHGRKHVATLDGQVDNFAHANHILIDVLNFLRNYYAIGQYQPPAPI